MAGMRSWKKRAAELFDDLMAYFHEKVNLSRTFCEINQQAINKLTERSPVVEDR